MASRRHRSATRNEHDRVGKEEGNPVRAKRAWVHQRRLHVVPKLPCAARRTPGRAAHHGPGGPRWATQKTPPAGDLNHALVQLDESAIAGNVGRDLAFAASRLAARSHPGVGGCAAPSSLVIFGISQPNARWTAGCSSPSGQRCSLHARTRHERAHICRGDDGRGTSRSRATACSRRAATAWQKDGFVAGTRAPRSGLPRVSVRVLASMRTGSPSRRCSCMRSMRATQPVRHRPVIAHAPCVGALREPTERPVHFVPANVILFLYQGKDFPGNTFDDESHDGAAELCFGFWEETTPAKGPRDHSVHYLWRRAGPAARTIQNRRLFMPPRKDAGASPQAAQPEGAGRAAR